MKAGVEAIKRAKDVEKTRRLLKQFLYALHISEDFGEVRLTRVLLKWTEVFKYVNDPANNQNDSMLMIDNMLEKVMPSRMITAIGRERIVDAKGNPIK